MLALVVASCLSTYAPSARLLADEPNAPLVTPEPSSVAPPAPPLEEASPAPSAPPPYVPPPPTHRKSVSFLLAGGELLFGALLGYGGLGLGILANIRGGGLSLPPDVTDVMLLAVLPGALAAGGAWLVGLFDLGQRNFFTNLLFAIAGGALGELVGLGAGVLLGRSIYPGDPSAAGLVSVAVAPAFAAFGAMLFMELFKPGEEVGGASLQLVPDGRGGIAAGPAWVGRF